MSNELITFKVFTIPNQAYLLKSKLECEGVLCFLEGEHLITANQLYSNAVGGLKLKVPKSDLNKAIEICQLMEEDLFEETKDKSDNNSLGDDYERIEMYCPNCESINVFRKKVRWDSILYFFLLFPVFIYYQIVKRNHICADCGHIWKF